MIRHSSRRAPQLVAAVLAALASLAAQEVRADGAADSLGGVSVEEVTAAPAEAGGRTRIGFVLDNASRRTVRLTGVESEAAASGALLVAPEGEPPRPAEGFTVLQEETLDLDSSHLRVELRGLRRRLAPGDRIGLVLIFREGRIETVAHVH